MRVLGVDRVGVRDSFFDLGGSSLTALEAATALERITGVELTPMAMAGQTLAQVAMLYQEGKRPSGRSVLAALRGAVGSGWKSCSGMQAMFFGPSDKPLFGVYYPPQSQIARDCGVILCNPIATCPCRCLHHLALLFAAAGFPAFRFDYFGTADSSGDLEQGSVSRWLEDIHSAATELRRRGSERLSVVGLCFGATLAALYAKDTIRWIPWSYGNRVSAAKIGSGTCSADGSWISLPQACRSLQSKMNCWEAPSRFSCERKSAR